MSETAEICGSRGPRIGSEGQPICKREPGHQGEHCPSLDDGWGESMSWSDPWRDPRPVTAAVPLVERLAEALLSQWWAEGAGVDEAGSDRAEAEHYARALLPVVDQAVAEARGEAAEPSYAEIVRAHAKTQAESSRTVDWRSFDAGYRAARAAAIAMTEGL